MVFARERSAFFFLGGTALLVMAILAMLIVTRRILDALDLLEDFVILIRALCRGYELRAALKVKQILCTGNRGQPMRDHDDS